MLRIHKISKLSLFIRVSSSDFFDLILLINSRVYPYPNLLIDFDFTIYFYLLPLLRSLLAVYLFSFSYAKYLSSMYLNLSEDDSLTLLDDPNGIILTSFPGFLDTSIGGGRLAVIWSMRTPFNIPLDFFFFVFFFLSANGFLLFTICSSINEGHSTVKIYGLLLLLSFRIESDCKNIGSKVLLKVLTLFEGLLSFIWSFIFFYFYSEFWSTDDFNVDVEIWNGFTSKRVKSSSSDESMLSRRKALDDTKTRDSS